MSERKQISLIFSLFILSAILLSSCTARPDKPNILFILVDDLGWSDVAYNGSRVYETPRIDQLAAEGIVFTSFYAAGPVCSPTRASILTGKYPVRTGITTYLLEPARDPKHIENHLSLDELTIAEALNENGYTTGYFGKWHLGYSSAHWAAVQGFDVAIGGMDLPWAWKIAHPDSTPPDLDRSMGHTRFFSPHHLTFMENGPQGEYLTDRLTDETISFIEDNLDQPFFAFLSFHTVHTPLQAKNEIVEKYTQKMKKLGLDTKAELNPSEKQFQNNPNYAAMVEHMDHNVGRLIDCLIKHNLEEETILIYTSDNGGKGSVTSNFPLKGMKHNLDEGGIRVPTIVRWTGKTTPNTTVDIPLITNDFYPTLLELAQLPLHPDQHIDGMSISQIILNADTHFDRGPLFWHYPHGRMEGAVRSGDYKLLLNYKTGSSRLYNLSTDLSEKQDLSEIQPEKKSELDVLLRTWLVEVGARYPENFVKK